MHYGISTLMQECNTFDVETRFLIISTNFKRFLYVFFKCFFLKKHNNSVVETWVLSNCMSFDSQKCWRIMWSMRTESMRQWDRERKLHATCSPLSNNPTQNAFGRVLCAVFFLLQPLIITRQVSDNSEA